MNFDKYKNTLDYTADREAWRQEEGRLTGLFKSDLEQEYGTADNPKRHMLYGLAWGMGHANGLHNVDHYYNELVELIQ